MLLLLWLLLLFPRETRCVTKQTEEKIKIKERERVRHEASEREKGKRVQPLKERGEGKKHQSKRWMANEKKNGKVLKWFWFARVSAELC